MPTVTIPESAYPAIQALVHLSSEDFELLLKALAGADAAAMPDQFATHVAEKTPGIKALTTKAIVNELFKLASVKEDTGETLPDFAKSIADAALAAEQSEKFPFSEKDKDVLRDRLVRLFESKAPLGLTAKAWDLLTDAQHLYYTSKILTDIRPVFNEDGTATEAAVMIHHLMIHYRDSNDHKNFFVTLDSRDLKHLRGVLDRAERKIATLKPILKRSEVPYLDTEEG
jgi:hypothetical protein